MVPTSLPELPKPSRTLKKSQQPQFQNPNIQRTIREKFKDKSQYYHFLLKWEVICPSTVLFILALPGVITPLLLKFQICLEKSFGFSYIKFRSLCTPLWSGGFNENPQAKLLTGGARQLSMGFLSRVAPGGLQHHVPPFLEPTSLHGAKTQHRFRFTNIRPS